jgi:kynurenine formamidase
MKLTLTIRGRRVEIELDGGRSLAIALDFDGAQPNLLGVPPASRHTMRQGLFVGSTREGGPCNVDQISFIPHCNATHTESIGHIVSQPVPVADAVGSGLAVAALVTVQPRKAAETADTYSPPPQLDDRLITADDLQSALGRMGGTEFDAVILRTLPNDPAKKNARYGHNGLVPAYFTSTAIELLHHRGVRHLLADIPSIDRIFDEGQLTNHHLFWNVPQGSHLLGPDSLWRRTITEMIYVDDDVTDGLYLLNLQVPQFVLDAAPSRPLVFRAQAVET